ncbi:hypothetical protein H9N25_16015 [Pedobacter riviphilus]|uniref:Tetratricopeptide repeat protein n=1 Tax=Pedobacter riviphilus TaxID=2766984 RepID=A0ABX6TE32_9SPHI|nr:MULTISPECIES: hypothetical protein [Pedobacter]NII85521.1 tetratricopeptide (TPR) repeat protein [Pedobacter sp. SG908]NMN39562.1 tetratricopeptide (TPR) repeat protein [Pedobacter sp. SG918]QNR83451.1 hypothetical protein H9N25_16015 [Pedobacter riviphilus]
MNRILLTFSILFITNFNTFAQKAKEYYEKGLNAFEKKLDNQALLYLDSSINLKNDEYMSYQLRGFVKSSQGKFVDAIADFDKAIGLNPNDADNFAYRASAKGSNTDTNGAVQDLSQAIKISPRKCQYYRDRAKLYAKLKDTLSAKLDFDKAITLDPEDAYNFIERAMIKEAANDLRGALQDLNEGILIDPNQSPFYRHRAELHLKLRDTTSALSDYDNDIRLIKKDDPMFYWDHYDRATARFNKAYYQGCIEDCSIVISGLTTDSDTSLIKFVYKCRALANLKSTNYFAAIADCDEFYKHDPKDISIYLAKAEAYYMLSEFSNCITTINKAIAIHPTAEAYFYKSMANVKLNNLKEVENDLTKAINLNPSYFLAYRNRALLRGVQANYKGAVSDANVFLKNDPTDVKVLTTKGMALYFLNNKKEGCAIVKRAISLGDQTAKQFAKEKCK